MTAFLSSRGHAHVAPWLNPNNNASTNYQVSTLLTTIYYDAAGHEVGRYSGGHDWMSAGFEAIGTRGKPLALPGIRGCVLPRCSRKRLLVSEIHGTEQ